MKLNFDLKSSPQARFQFSLLLLGLAAAFAYFPFQKAEFLLWDDHLHLVANPLMKTFSLENLFQSWQGPYEGLFAPLLYNLWGVVVKLVELFNREWRENSIIRPFLFLNLALHSFNTHRVFQLVQKLDFGFSKNQALFVAGVFMLHPMQVESVCWASGFKELVWVAFGLLAIDSYWEDKIPKSVVFFLAALFCKPTAAVLPLIMAAIRPQRVQWKVLAGELVAGAGVLAGTKYLQPDTLLEPPGPLQERLIVALDALGFYTGKLLWPFALSTDYGRRPGDIAKLGITPMIGLGLAALIALTAVAVLVRRHRISRSWACPTVFILAPLLPVLGLVPFAFQNYSTVADRYIYFPMIGFAILAVKASWKWSRQPALLLFTILIAYSWLGHQQAKVWRTNEALYLHALKYNTNSFMAYNNLGVLAQWSGRSPEALGLFQKSLSLAPGFRDAAKNVGAMLVNLNKTDEAIAHYEQYMKFAPNYSEFLLGYGTALLRKGDLTKAIENLSRAIQLDPNNASTHQQFAIALNYGGRAAEAKEHFERAIQLEPKNQEYINNYEVYKKQFAPQSASETSKK